MELLLIRHGQSRANTGECAECDCELTDLGRRQALAIGRELADLHDLQNFTGITSPYRRARDTARLIGEASGLRFDVDPGCREVAQSCNVDGVHYAAETIEAAVGRISDFRNTLQADGRYMIVSHATPIFILVQLCTGVSAEETVRRCEGDFWQVILNCRLTHVRENELVCLSR